MAPRVLPPLSTAAIPLLLAVFCGCLGGRDPRPVGSRCAEDGDCAPGLTCQYGRCRAECAFDRDCPSGSCIPSEEDPSVRVCVLPDEGATGVDCPAGTEPDDDGVCRVPCESHDECGDGYACVDDFCEEATDVEPGDWDTAGPYGASVTGLAIDPDTTTTVYAAGAGVYRSSNGGDLWESADSGLASAGSVYSLAMDPTEPRVLYAGTGDGVYRTDDGATSWTKASSGLAAGEVRTLVVDHTTPALVYAGVKTAGVYRSDDGGANWSAKNAGLDDFNIYFDALIMDPEDSSRLWLGTWLGGVYFTSTGGAMWKQISTDARVIYSLAHGHPANTLYAGAFQEGVYISGDAGATWTLSTSLGSASVKALAVDAAGTLYAGTAQQGLARTVDAGVHWQWLDADMPYLTADGHIAIDPDDSEVLYVGTPGGVVRSRDGGTSWTLLTEGMAPHEVRALAVRHDVANRVFAATWRGGFFASDDRAMSWTAKSHGLGVLESRNDALAVDPENGSKMVIATWGGVYRTDDGGRTWTGPTRGGNFFSAAADPARRGVYYAAEFEDGLWRSDDWGELWGLTTLLDGNIKALAVDPTGTIYAGSRTEGVWKSFDGFEWEPENGGLPDDGSGNIDASGHIAIDPTDPEVLFVALPDGVYRSSDGGLMWSLTRLTVAVSSLVVDPADPDHLIAGSAAGVHESRDGGDSWEGPELGIPVLALALSPDSATLYAATDQGVWFR